MDIMIGASGVGMWWMGGRGCIRYNSNEVKSLYTERGDLVLR